MSKKSFNGRVVLCQLHINLKNENALKTTVFFLEARLLTVKECLKKECRKVERDFLQFNFMFRRGARLSREEIEEVMKKGGVTHTSVFSLRILDSGSRNTKFAFVISKKECKTAVGRNRAKRRARSAMQKLVPNLKKPLFCMVFLKKEVIKVPFSELVDNLRITLEKKGFV